MRKWTIMLIAVMMMFVLAACSGNKESDSKGSAAPETNKSSTPAETKPPEKKKNVTLSIMINQTWNKPSLQPVLDKYEELHDHVTIDLQVIPDGQFTPLMNTKIATKEVPDIVFDNYSGLLKNTRDGAVLVELNNEPWLARLIDPETVRTKDGNIYGMPTNSSGAVGGIIYNKKLFAEHGLKVPSTLDEFLELCAKIKALGISPLIMSGNEAWTVGMYNTVLMPNVVQDDPNLTWEDLNTGKVKFSDVPGFMKIYDTLLELVKKGYFNDNFMSTTEAMSKELFMQGKGAMILQGDWFIADLKTTDESLEMGMFAFPLTPKAYLNTGSLQAFSIFKDSKNVDESKKLLEYLAEADQAKTFNMDWSTYPAFKDVEIELPDWKKEIKANTVDAGMSPLLSAGVKSEVPLGTLTSGVQAMLSGAISPEDVLKEWDAEFARIAKERKLPGWE